MKKILIAIMDYIQGWMAASKQPDHEYQYVIDGIQLKTHNELPATYIRYKLVGCRTPLYELAKHLNNSHLFSLFRPDHAQIIVSIATIEALLHKSPADIMDRYQQYIQQCAAQFMRK